MSRVKVTQEHTLEPEELKSRVSDITEELGRQFQLKSEWQDESTVRFKRSGLSGTLNLSESQVDVDLKLGLMLGSLKGPIAKELKAQMQKRLT